MQKLGHFWRKKNFTRKSHLRPSCTKPFNYSDYQFEKRHSWWFLLFLFLFLSIFTFVITINKTKEKGFVLTCNYFNYMPNYIYSYSIHWQQNQRDWSGHLMFGFNNKPLIDKNLPWKHSQSWQNLMKFNECCKHSYCVFYDTL